MAQQVGPGQGSADGSVRSRDREERSRDDGLPVSTLREATPHLRRPFTPEAVKFKVQSVFKEAKGCLVAPYIDARLVVERLNLVVPDMWHATYDHIEGTKLAWCHLSIRAEQFSAHEVITRSDVGESPKGMSKDLVSDSLKRAAVHFGVGVSIYALPQIVWFTSDKAGKLEKKQGPKGPTLALTKDGHRSLRESYTMWLDRYGTRLFGEPLDHGDEIGAEFEDSEPEVEDFVPEAAPALEDDEAQRLTAEIRRVYSLLSKAPEGSKQVPPARFNAWLQGAAHSHVELQRLLDYLKERAVVLGGGA